MASRSSLRSQNIFQSHLSLGHSLMIECFACLWMLFLFSNAKNYPGFTELASLAKIYFQSHLSLGVTLILKCFISLGILFLFSNAGNSPGFTQLASLATYFPITLALLSLAPHGARFARKIFFNHTCRWMFLLFSDALFVFGYYSCFRMLGIHLASRSSLRSQNII